MLKFPVKVTKWNNSLALRLPAAVVEALKLKECDEIEVRVASARDFAVARKPGRAELLNRLRAFRGRLPPDFRFDRDEGDADVVFANPFAPTRIDDVAGMARYKSKRLSLRDMEKAVMKEAARRR